MRKYPDGPPALNLRLRLLETKDTNFATGCKQYFKNAVESDHVANGTDSRETQRAKQIRANTPKPGSGLHGNQPNTSFMLMEAMTNSRGQEQCLRKPSQFL